MWTHVDRVTGLTVLLVDRVTGWTVLPCGPCHRVDRITMWIMSLVGPCHRVDRVTMWIVSPGPYVLTALSKADGNTGVCGMSAW